MQAKGISIAAVLAFTVFMVFAAGCNTLAPPTVTQVPTQAPSLAPTQALTPDIVTPQVTIPTPTPTKQTPLPTPVPTPATYQDTDFLMAYDTTSRALSENIGQLTIALAGSSTIGDTPPAFPAVRTQSLRLIAITDGAIKTIEPMDNLKNPQNRQMQAQYLNYTSSLNVAGQALVQAANLSIEKNYPMAIRSYLDADAILADTIAFPDPDNKKVINQLRYYIGQVISSLQNRIDLARQNVTYT